MAASSEFSKSCDDRSTNKSSFSYSFFFSCYQNMAKITHKCKHAVITFIYRGCDVCGIFLHVFFNYRQICVPKMYSGILFSEYLFRWEVLFRIFCYS